MDRYDMMALIAETLADGESLVINVTSARGRTFVESYMLNNIGIAIYIGHSWGGRGNLRDEYKKRVINRSSK